MNIPLILSYYININNLMWKYAIIIYIFVVVTHIVHQMATHHE